MQRRCDFSQEVCQPFLWQGGEHGVLILHGFSGSIAQMRPLAELLRQQGFTVMGVNLPGHATVMSDMGRCTWVDWVDAAKNAFLELKRQCKWTSVAGLSMGGCLALLLAEQMQPTAVAPISAPMGTKAPLFLTGLLAPFVKEFCWQPRKEENALDADYDYCYPGFPTKAGPQLAHVIRQTRRDLYAVTCPTLVVQSRADETITASSAEVILQGISAKKKGVLWLEDVPHVVTLSKEKERVAQALAAHFRAAEMPES